ncbi:epoxide hydrolase family protein [Iodidimonas sp. SYSU 1G8]|uniref:epoxide hydrolase family protein n=1 Tax=Iodidimonas sp. SYSU 1G8 TaxID=3133967 RepID=UPI0031FE6E61
MHPFTVDIPQHDIDRITRRVRAYDWFEEPVDAGWQYGANGSFMRRLCAYWLDQYDWRRAETSLNRFPQFKAEVKGIPLHFIHEKGSGSNPKALILLHGWPGSYFEFLNCIERLAHPERFGGDAEEGCDVIVPSLVGYGWSGKPPRPIDPRAQAGFMNGLMTNVLGYDTYVAQGGDWGSSITAWLGFDHGTDRGGACGAIHMNMFGLRPGGTFRNIFGVGVAQLDTAEEKAWAREAARRGEGRFGYMVLQSTKPQSLSYAMMDSPVGTAAWITEKMQAWGQRTDGDMPVFSMDQILTNVMIYLTSRTFNTAAWQYWAVRETGHSVLPGGERIMVPAGFADYPGELAPVPPLSYLEKAYARVVYRSAPARGGHFAALEQPELFVNDLQDFLKVAV